MKRPPLITRIAEVKAMAGTIPTAELAAYFGTTKGSMSVFCSQHGISLKPVDGIEKITPEQLALAKELAGTMCQADVAKRAGMSVETLRKLCSRHGISARYYKPRPRKEKKEPTLAESRRRSERAMLESQLDAASLLLRSHGWTVLRPDPFLTLAHQRPAQSHNSGDRPWQQQ